jgi:hypothetical protein
VPHNGVTVRTGGMYSILCVYSAVAGEVADWVQQAGYLSVAAGDFFGTGQLRTHDEGFVVKNRWTVRSS